MRDSEQPGVEEPKFRNRHQYEGSTSRCFFKDEEQMKEVSEKLEKLKSESCSQSIRDGLKKEEIIFSEESCRMIFEMGNLELFELRQTTDAVQCHSCLKYVPRGLKFCECGVCLRPDEETIQNQS